MANQPQQPEVIDPDNVPEIICNGQFNISIAGELATFTFTHVRPDPAPMFRDGRFDIKAVVRARIVTTVANVHAIRDLLNRLTQSSGTPAPSTGGSTRH
jgi:hypothetical protein